MLDEVTDNTIIKVVHLFPRYALAKGDVKNYREQVQDKSPKTATRPRLPFTHPTKNQQKAL